MSISQLQEWRMELVESISSCVVPTKGVLHINLLTISKCISMNQRICFVFLKLVAFQHWVHDWKCMPIIAIKDWLPRIIVIPKRDITISRNSVWLNVSESLLSHCLSRFVIKEPGIVAEVWFIMFGELNKILILVKCKFLAGGCNYINSRL